MRPSNVASIFRTLRKHPCLLSCLSILAAAPLLFAEVAVDYDATWKYKLPTSDPGTGWRTVGFNDASWDSGPALLGFENSPLPIPGLQTVIGTSGSPQMVYLFRHTFQYTGSLTGATFAIDQIADDGVTYYLNGALLGSSRHTPGAYNNAADGSVGDASLEPTILTGNATALVNGTNVLSAEVHQISPGGSDLVFGARLTINTPPQNSEEWRQSNFGTTDNSGDAADLADPDNDRLPNLMEYALLQDPNKPAKRWGKTSLEGSNLVLTYVRRKSALGEMSFECLWANDPNGPWTNSGVIEQIQSDDQITQTVRATVVLDGDAKKFFQVRVTRISATAPTAAIATPVRRIVYQRNNSNQAFVPVAGTCSANATRIEARLVTRPGFEGTTTTWTTVDPAPTDGIYQGKIPGYGGWYSLEVRAIAGTTIGVSTILDRLGIGEVFVAVGHSVAHGQEINIAGATDERVTTIPLDRDGQAFQDYKTTGNIQHLPAAYGFFGNNVVPAPFGHGTYFWSQMGQYLVERLQVPVCFYNAAFGGTSLEHWAKASQGIYFDHGFVNATIRMPYINLENVLKKYIPLSGIRGVLADQGANDWPRTDENAVFNDYVTWVNQARADVGHSALAIVVNRHTPFFSQPGGTPAHGVRRVQQRMIDTFPNCFTGPDYDLFDDSSPVSTLRDRHDYTHLGAPGEVKAALWWADAITNSNFLNASIPYLPVF